MTILYYHPYSQHSRRVVALLQAANIEFEARRIALENAAYLAGVTPTIADLLVACNISHLALAGAAPTNEVITAWFDRVSEIKGFRDALPPALAA